MFVALFGAAGCGSGGRAASSSTKAPVTGTGPVVARPALGLTEDNADLLWPPGEGGNGSATAFQAARTELTALHPSYLRLLVDWAALQPSREQPPDLQARIDGCARGVRPCGAYGGIRAEFAAIAAQQRSATDGGPGAFRIVLDVFGAPAWAAKSASGCELPGGTPFARPLDATAIGGYRALVRSLLEMARVEGVTLEWWSPWNEPNDPRFISPQRSSCTPSSPALSPAVYAQLVRAMAAELQEAGRAHHLVLGELNDLEVGSPHTTSVAEFIAALPTDVLCLGTVYSIHAYARYREDGEQASLARPVEALETALDARGGCARKANIWVTEAGAGGPHPGQPLAARAAAAPEEEDGCRALSDQLQGWDEDPRVTAVFQYSFRDDPDFPVGLISADLAHLHRTYALWLDWSRSRRTGQGMPSPTLCA